MLPRLFHSGRLTCTGGGGSKTFSAGLFGANGKGEHLLLPQVASLRLALGELCAFWGVWLKVLCEVCLVHG
eukprot:3070178-Rhodomonas_salina.1